ncbi:hypothetical protein TcWFU_003596 [Taenia crassiceps]|uniref:Uncharacterized protein n=1 Tax=Taenia crassiceps TaxID=6207 RepID=A0ABR4QDA4_9CEST
MLRKPLHVSMDHQPACACNAVLLLLEFVSPTTLTKIQASRDREIDVSDIWNYACREIQRSLEKGKVNTPSDQTLDSSHQREKVKSLINLLKLDAFSEPTPSTHISGYQLKSSRSIPRRIPLRKFLRVKYSRDHRDIQEFSELAEAWGRLKANRRLQNNLSNMEENSSETEIPRRRISRHSKPVKRPVKRQLQQSYRLPSKRSHPHGDEASFTQSQLHGQVQEQTEFDSKSNEKQNLKLPKGVKLAPTATLEVIEDTEKLSCLQGETIIIAIERTDHTADISQSIEDLDLKDLKSQCVGDLVYQDDLGFVSSDTFITRIPTAIAELISQRRNFRSKECLFARIDFFNKALKNSVSNVSLSPMMADCVPLVNLASPEYESMKSKEVTKNSDERNYIFTSHLIISASVHAVPLPRMIAEYIPKQAAFSVISDSNMREISIERQMMNCAELQTWRWVEGHPVGSLYYHHLCMCDDDAIGEEVLEGELEVSLLGSPVVSNSLILESSLANGLDSFSFSCSYSSSTLATDSSTISSTSTTPTTTTTNFWMLVENSPALETEEISEMEDVTARSTCSLTRTEIRRMINLEILTYDYDGILIAYVLTIIGLLTPGIRHTGVLRIVYLLAKKSLLFIWRIISRIFRFLYYLLPSNQQKPDKRDSDDVAVSD